MHKLLARQLRKHFGGADAAPEGLREFLRAVDEAYEQADLDRRLLERSLDLTAKELLDANAKLREDRASLATRYQRLFEDSPHGVYLSSPDGTLIDINPAGVRLFGYESKDEMFSLDLAHDVYQNPGDRGRMLETLRRDGFVKDHEVTLRRRDGAPITVLITSAVIRDEDGTPTGIHGILRDVTFERELERNLRNTQKMEAVGRLAGGVAHDFNNLLAVIIGSADLLRMKIGPDAPWGRHVDEIKKAADRGAALTRQLLVLGKSKVAQPASVDLNRCLTDMEDLLRRLLDANVDLRLWLEPDLPVLVMDPSQLEQVIMNLVVNARDAMPGGGRLTVSTRRVLEAPSWAAAHVGASSRGFVVLSVRDTGSGIPRDIVDRIFEPFFTTKEKGKGTGLGLATVYGIVRQAGGHIDVVSEIGAGSEFRMIFPGHAGRVSSASLPKPGREAAAARNETILLVEDEEPLRAMLAEYLRGLGYRVLEACDGAEALARLKGHGAVDAIVTDMVMPHMGGADLIAHVRARTADLPILVMTGYADVPVPDCGSANLRCLQKPFAPAVLGAALRGVFDGEGRDAA